MPAAAVRGEFDAVVLGSTLTSTSECSLRKERNVLGGSCDIVSPRTVSLSPVKQDKATENLAERDCHENDTLSSCPSVFRPYSIRTRRQLQADGFPWTEDWRPPTARHWLIGHSSSRLRRMWRYRQKSKNTKLCERWLRSVSNLQSFEQHSGLCLPCRLRRH